MHIQCQVKSQGQQAVVSCDCLNFTPPLTGLTSVLPPCRINSLSDKWRERITVRLSPLITFHSKMRASWRSNLRTTKAKKKSPEPKVFGQQTSTFYVDTEGRELSANEMFEASSDYRSSYSQNELLQYRPELIVD